MRGGLVCVFSRAERRRYMIEGTPGVPYGGGVEDLLKVQPNMQLRCGIANCGRRDRCRRATANAALPPNTRILAITAFPRHARPAPHTRHY